MHNKTIKSLLFIISLTFVPAFACAKSSPYLRADVGAAFSQKFNQDEYGKKSPKESVIYGIGAGYVFNDNIRADFTISRMHNFKFDHTLKILNRVKQNINSTQLLVNGYFDLVNYCNFTPYVGAGLGAAYNQTKAYNLVFNSAYQRGAHKINFAWNIGAGAAYKVTQNFALDLGYKFHDLGKITTSPNLVMNNGVTNPTPSIKTRLKAHAVTLGIRYTF